MWQVKCLADSPNDAAYHEMEERLVSVPKVSVMHGRRQDGADSADVLEVDSEDDSEVSASDL